MRINKAEQAQVEAFVQWRGRSMQPGVVICIEIEECDLVLTDYANSHPAESPGTVRAWANVEGMVPDECPGHPGMFVLSPRTPNEAFAIRMRWG